LILDPADIIAAAGPMRHAELARPERKAVNE
jgi:hypothetical protein